ncbi:hypothetical protein DOTSEDRAFT_52146 [Dothistroma septosporum NZE10]|uniref:Uncharacterized protein n=1 Tax=Dothistroma septosporum (strain NZE10 / CBS 128990) TaxID=675120 RepID=N1PWI2_DOTSN|nr:hypothetical protein DOTSEDRAFT_52146 [Dothistroma septosporum NZE10]
MEQDDWQTEHFSSRRIGHGRKGKGSAKSGVFDPRRSYGTYELKCPALTKLPSTIRSGLKSKNDEATLEIHGPVPGRDDALMCSIELSGILCGVAILAGSRKALNSVVQDLEHPEPEENEEEEEEDQDTADEEAASGNSDKAEDSNDEEARPKSSIELADEKERRRYAAFEKNSFRSPKFWMRWRAMVVDVSSQYTEPSQRALEAGNDLASSTDDSSDRHVEIDGGYLVFSGNDCANFHGTISCASFDWKNVKLSGKKVVSKAREAPRGWTDIGVDEA